MRRLGPFGLFVICGLTATLAASAAQARKFSPWDLLGHPPAAEQNQHEQPLVGIYDTDDGMRFVFDRLASPPLMRFESSPEIWVLHPEPGPRGDILYKNDLGEPMLRATRLGGLTLFTPGRPAGTAVSLETPAPPIKPSAILTVALLEEHLIQSSARASRAMQRLIVFEAPDVTPDSATLIADAGQVASEAVIASTRRPDLHRLLMGLRKVVIQPARRAGATYKDGVLEIDFTQGQGLAGRPSSRRIEAVFLH